MKKEKNIFPPRRDPARGRATLLGGVIIVIGIAIVAFGGVFAYKYLMAQKEKSDIEISGKTYNQQEQSLVRNLLGLWSQKTNETVPVVKNCVPDRYDITFDFKEKSLVYLTLSHCRLADFGTWSLDGDTITLISQTPESVTRKEKVILKGTTLNLSDDGEFKRFVGDPDIDSYSEEQNQEIIQRWEKLINN